MFEGDGAIDIQRLRAEHRLFRRLLDLSRQEAIEPFLREALALLVEAAQARQGYLELYGDDDALDGTPRWSIAHGFSAEEVETVRTLVSRGIIAATLADGETVLTASARTDP